MIKLSSYQWNIKQSCHSETWNFFSRLYHHQQALLNMLRAWKAWEEWPSHWQKGLGEETIQERFAIGQMGIIWMFACMKSCSWACLTFWMKASLWRYSERPMEFLVQAWDMSFVLRTSRSVNAAICWKVCNIVVLVQVDIIDVWYTINVKMHQSLWLQLHPCIPFWLVHSYKIWSWNFYFLKSRFTWNYTTCCKCKKA